MLKGVSPLISPELLKVLCEMGHGEEIVIGDANFPAALVAPPERIIRADGIGAAELLDAILELIPLDQYDSEHFVLMKIPEGSGDEPSIWDRYRNVCRKHEKDFCETHTERFAFYERAKHASAVVETGETAIYANIILKKGVI